MNLAAFLVQAKVNTYAAGGGGGARLLADGCKELEFQQGDFAYRDRYFGSNPFVGEEVVLHGGRVVWAMNYYGAVSADDVPADLVYQFLCRALGQVEEGRPFRGPRLFLEDDFEYHDESQGTVERFTGVETILERGREIYRLVYHGGAVKGEG